MKKRFLIFALCFALLCLTACGTAAPQEPTQSPDAPQTMTQTPAGTDAADVPTEAQTDAPTDAPTEAETFVAATVSVRFADGSLPPAGQYETFDVPIEDAQTTKIVLSTNAVVRDFKVLALTDGAPDEDGNMRFTAEELYTLDRLTPDRPLVVSTVFYGLIPNNGVSYVDETGATRCFAIDMSGEDGSLYLWEYE